MARRYSVLAVLLLSCAPSLFAQVVRSASGNAPADITTARDQFRTDLGGGTVAGANGSFGGIRREINWDGVPDSASAPNNLPANFFNVNSPRGVVFSTPGTGFQVSANAGVAPVEFDNINPNYSTQFQTFSAQRLFTALGSNITDVNFFIAGTATPAVVQGFGAVFTDVDLAGTTIEFFDAAAQSLGKFNVPASASGGLSFLGVSGFPGGAVIGRVRITSGTGVLGAGSNDGSTNDLAVMDDFIYSEPAAAVVASADLSIDKSGPANAFVGIGYSYTLLVTNNGPDPATNVVVTDTLPAGLTATSTNTTQGSCSGTTTVTCNLGTLNNGATATITIGTTAPAPGDLSNTATVSGTEADPSPNNNSDTVRTIAAAIPAPVPTAGAWALTLLATMLLAVALLRLRL